MKDYYRILGTTKQASADEIKRAYRRLASQHHPDKGGDKTKFQEVQEAYSVLGDENKRREYDNPRPQMNFGFTGMPGGVNLEELFGMFNVNMRTQAQQPRVQLWISLHDVATGGPRPISLQMGNQVSTVQIDIPPGINDGDSIRYPRLSPDGHDLVVTYRIKPDAVWQRDGRNVMTERKIDVFDLILGTNIALQDLTGTTLEISVPAGTQPGSLLRARGRGLPPSTLPGRYDGPPGDLLVRVQALIPSELPGNLLDAIRQTRGQ